MATPPKTITSKAVVTLELPPSCAQFCPAHPEYFVIGTYNLKAGDGEGGGDAGHVATKDSGTFAEYQSRNGSLVVFRTDGSTLTQVQTLMQPSAILDLRFNRTATKASIMAVVSSTGSLAIFELDSKDSASPLRHIATSRCDDTGEDVLFLQCQWHPYKSDVLAVTTSTGLARLVILNDKWEIAEFTDLDIGNSLEAWCIEFSPPAPEAHSHSDPITIYCGGDDSVLRFISCKIGRGNLDQLSSEQELPPATVNRLHGAGVTAILPLPLFGEDGGRMVLTGSYDDHVRLLSIHDLHQTYGLKRVTLLAEMNLEGGVWRLDLVSEPGAVDTHLRIRILASCMYAGARLIEFRRDSEDEAWSCDILGRFEEHKSMNYACAYMPGAPRHCISTSFYDKLLCLWDYTPTSDGRS